MAGNQLRTGTGRSVRPEMGKTLNSAVIHCFATSPRRKGTQTPSPFRLSPAFTGRFRASNAPQGLPPLREPAKGLPPFETGVRGMASDTSHRKDVPPLKSPPKGCCPWMQLLVIPFRLTPSIDPFQDNGTGCLRDTNLGLAKIACSGLGCPLASGRMVVRCRPPGVSPCRAHQ